MQPFFLVNLSAKYATVQVIKKEGLCPNEYD